MSKNKKSNTATPAKTIPQTETKSAKKLKRSEPVSLKILKLAMIIPFAYSGFFWGLISVLNLYMDGSLDKEANLMLVGIILTFASIVMAFLRLYILQFPVAVVGVAFYMNSATSIVARAVEKGTIKDNGKALSDVLEVRHYMIIFLAVLSAMLCAYKIYTIISKKLEQKHARDNAPAESILGD